MDRSISLLERATRDARYVDVAEAIGVGHSALANSKRVGHLSPLLAGQLALFLSEPVEHWMAVAALECAKPGRARKMLEGHFQKARNCSLSSQILSQYWHSWCRFFSHVLVNHAANNHQAHSEMSGDCWLCVA